MSSDVGSHYLDEIRRQFRGYKRIGEAAITQVKDDELVKLIDPESNSIAMLIKHIAGNARSRFTDFLNSDGEKPDRFRDREFEIHPGITRAEIMKWWEEGWNYVFSAVEPLKPEDLLRETTIRGEPHTGLQALNRAMAHYSCHVGQIVFLAKHFRSQDWNTLSVPKGQSEEFNARMREKLQAK